MPKFTVGDRVRCLGPHIPKYMGDGTVVHIIPHPDQIDGFVQYEVRFMFATAVFYESQLMPVAKTGPTYLSCRERRRLADAYVHAANAYVKATSHLADVAGMVPEVEFEFLR